MQIAGSPTSIGASVTMKCSLVTGNFATPYRSIERARQKTPYEVRWESSHMPRDLRPIEGWPRLMAARTAAAYCGERSVAAFRRAVGKIWPRPKQLLGKGARWPREDLDQAIDEVTQKGGVKDLADVL